METQINMNMNNEQLADNLVEADDETVINGNGNGEY